LTAHIHQLAWLADDVAIVVGDFSSEDRLGGEALLNGEPVSARLLVYEAPNGATNLLTLHLPRRWGRDEPFGPLSLKVSGRKISVEPPELRDVTVELQSLVRSALAPLPAHTRTKIVEFLSATTTQPPSAPSTTLTRGLVTINEALRERLAPSVVNRDEAIGCAVECVLAVDGCRFFMQGWFRDALAPVTSLRAVSPEGYSIELLDKIYRFQRPDLETLYGAPSGDPSAGTGFACCFDLPMQSVASGGWIIELRDAAGNAVEAAAPLVVASPGEVCNMLLGDVMLERLGEVTLTRDHIYPAISRLQERNSRRLKADRVIQFGEPPTNPEVSIIVPLYRRIDFLEHQLAQFALDPEIPRCDLIYVLDSPEQSRDLVSFAAALSDLYRLPFRVVTLEQSVGYAGANLAGVSLARGRLLLLLNSDVLPERPGWISAMVSFYDLTPRIGALGPKLLFEDESIQHAGLFFRRPVNSTFWENDHYFKGLHRDAAPARVSRVVPAVTGACMLVDRILFNELGGFNGSFVRGDYEDSDFCLRLVEAGRDNWYLADVTLYHLEGQSYETGLRLLAARYNAWLHTHLWGERIAEVMERFSPEMTTKVAPSMRKGRVPARKAAQRRSVMDEIGAQ
jgi:GT2 family glycosyltransferase